MSILAHFNAQLFLFLRHVWHKVILADTCSTENPKKCDMISDLPDEVLVHILSFLPTKEAFKTSILSSRWKNLWTAVPNLDFKPNCYSLSQYNTDEEHRYMEFIKKIFISHNSSINKCHMSCTPQFDMSVLKAWIITIVERNVQDINISCFDKDMELPVSLFTCKTLCTLKLHRVLQHDVPASIHFPCLKVLHIWLLSPSSVLTQKLFCSSPLLEDLEIIVEYKASGGDNIYNIYSPSLKKLYVHIIKYCSDNLNCVVNVDAPILESLEVTQEPYVHFILKNSKTLKKAGVCYYKPRSHDQLGGLIKLLKLVSFVKDPSLGGYLPQVVKVFGNSSEDNWPPFPFVTHLTLDIRNDFGSWRLPRWNIFPNLINLQLNLYCIFSFKNILNILSGAPNLSTLLIYKFGYDEIFSLEQTKLPSCLSSHVKEIELLGFRGCRSELKMIRYLLENARVLEKLTVEISCYNLFGRMPELKREWFTKEIATLPRSSKNCKFVVII